MSGEHHIYNTIVETLQVAVPMHYARQVAYDSGVRLLDILRADNRQVTTRSLTDLFGALLGLRMKQNEHFD